MTNPLLLPLGWVTRAKTINEGRQLRQQIKTASQTANELLELNNTVAKSKPNILLPGVAAAGAGLLAGKTIADQVPPKPKRVKDIYDSLPTAAVAPMSHMGNTADFIFLEAGLLASVENGLASAIHGVNNSRLKKKLQNINAGNLLTQGKIEAQRVANNKAVPTKLAAIGLGTAAVTAPAVLAAKAKQAPPPIEEAEYKYQMYNVASFF